MSTISPDKLPNELLTDYYGQMIFLYSHLGNYTGGANNEYYIKERAYKDSIINVIEPSHPDYLWYKGWDILGTDKKDSELIPALIKKLSEGNSIPVKTQKMHTCSPNYTRRRMTGRIS